jgi:hypothetical protein
MVVLPYIVYFKLLLVWIAYFFSFYCDSMASQNRDD